MGIRRKPGGRAAVIAILLALAAGSATAREISGALAYRERVALPPDAVLIVEATDALGRPLALLRQPSGGAQVPLGFTLEISGDGDVLVRGGIAVGGDIRWLGNPVVVAAGQDAVDLGTVALAPYRMIGFARHYRCGDLAVEAGFRGDDAILRVAARYLTLAAVEAASGAKYADPAEPETWLWSKGDALTVSLAGTVLPECASALPAGDGWRATGHEPDWLVEVAAGQLRYAPLGGEPAEAALPAPEPAADGALYRLDPLGLVLTVTPTLCRDTMTGMPHPDRVTLAEGGRILTGCGGNPAALIAGPDWRVVEVAGAALPEGAEASLRFGPGGALLGRAACNRFTGRHALSGEGLRLEPGGMTMMACPEPVMAAERAVIDALSAVDRFDFDAAGDLLLIGGDATLIRARF